MKAEISFKLITIECLKSEIEKIIIFAPARSNADNEIQQSKIESCRKTIERIYTK